MAHLSSSELHVRTPRSHDAQHAVGEDHEVLFAGSPTKGQRQLHGSPRGAAGAKKPLLRQGWFWGISLTLAVALVVVVVVAVAFTRGGLGGRSVDSGTTPLLLEFDFSSSTPRPPLKLQGSSLVRADGQPVTIHSINWFGFNNGKTMVDGLDAEVGGTWEGGDFATIVQTLKLLGFNAIRLPFQFSDLYDRAPLSYDKPCPGPLPTAESLAARTTAPGASTGGKAAPALPPPPRGSKPGICNGYLPTSSTLARYVWVVQYLANTGSYVLVDQHTHELSEPALASPEVYAANWLQLWRALTALPDWETALRGRVWLDVFNEPDEHKLGYDGPLAGSRHTASLSDYLLAVMDAINTESPTPDSTLFFLQGGGQSSLGTSWGDGFATNQTCIQRRGLSDANAFFTALLDKPYRRQVVLSPHLYAFSITKSPDVGAAQWLKYEIAWGTLQKTGYCRGADCQTFPVVPGEIGSAFTNPLDSAYYRDLATFMKRQPPADRYESVAFGHYFWWCWNANSGDTGGLVQQDWRSLVWSKLRWLQDNVGLTPWYQS